MCGIVGIISKKTTGFWQTDAKVFEQLLWADQLRGVDGTGVFFNNKKNKVFVRKAPVNAESFILNKSWDKIKTAITQEATFIIGHNRWATKGNLVYKDTHPFSEGNITLVHNGTLYFHRELADVDVDSHAIAIAFNKMGHIEALKKLDGAFALVWHDKETNKLHFVRNKERPLNVIETKDAYVICSEMALGEWILSRNNVKVEKKWTVPTETLFSIDLDSLEMTEDKVEFRKEVYITKGYYSDYGDYGGYYGNYSTKKENVVPFETKKLPAVTHAKKESILGKTICFDVMGIKNVSGLTFLEGWYENEQGQELAVRFYGESPALYQWSKCDMLSGVVVNEVWSPTTNSKYLTVRDVEEATVSKNGLIIPEDVRKNLPAKCHCCGGSMNYSPVNMQYMNINYNNEKKEWQPYCPDCTDYAEALQQEYADQVVMGC